MAKDALRRIGPKKIQASLQDSAERTLMLARLLHWAAEEAVRLGREAEAGELEALSRRVRELPQPGSGP